MFNQISRSSSVDSTAAYFQDPSTVSNHEIWQARKLLLLAGLNKESELQDRYRVFNGLKHQIEVLQEGRFDNLRQERGELSEHFQSLTVGISESLNMMDLQLRFRIAGVNEFLLRRNPSLEDFKRLLESCRRFEMGHGYDEEAEGVLEAGLRQYQKLAERDVTVIGASVGVGPNTIPRGGMKGSDGWRAVIERALISAEAAFEMGLDPRQREFIGAYFESLEEDVTNFPALPQFHSGFQRETPFTDILERAKTSDRLRYYRDLPLPEGRTIKITIGGTYEAPVTTPRSWNDPTQIMRFSFPFRQYQVEIRDPRKETFLNRSLRRLSDSLAQYGNPTLIG